MLFSCASAAVLNTSDYDLTVAGKLYKQIADGSGFSGTMHLEIHNAGDDSVIESVPFAWDYIHVLPTGLSEEERRFSLHLMDGETAAATTYAQYQDQKLRFQSSLLGESWYELSAAPSVVSGINAEKGKVEEQTAQTAEAFAQGLGLPAGMLRFAPVLLASFTPADENLPLLLDRFLTKLDIWLEGFRTGVEMGQTDDGASTLRFSYSISPSNVKAQVKQMIVDMLSDAAMVDKLTGYYGEDIAASYFNPFWQPYYLAAVDALPLEENLTIDRTVVAFTGETLSLSLSLPYSDPVMGDCVLNYSRELGKDQQPLNQISLESENRTVTLEYMEYNSLTDVSVLQGSFISVPAENAENVKNAENAAAPLAVAFVLKMEETEGKQDDGYLTQNLSIQLSLAPDQESDLEDQQEFPPMNIDLTAAFSSKEPAKAATQIEASLAVYGESDETRLVMQLNGKTRVKWTPDELPAEIVSVDAMTDEQRSAMTQEAVSNLLSLLLPHLSNIDLGASVSDGTDSSIGIIGGADGPTSISLSTVGEPETSQTAETEEVPKP